MCRKRFTFLYTSHYEHVVASELKDPICHSNECQIGSFSSEATMCNITFQVFRLSTCTFVFNKCSEKKIFTIIVVVKSFRLAQRRRRWPSITSALGQCIVLFGVFGADMLKRHQHNAAVRKHGTITQCCFNDRPASKTVGQHWHSIG